MLRNLSEEIRECHRHAEDCARKAAAQTDQQLKADFLNLERRWLFLARSYEFTERLTDFSDETKRQAEKLPGGVVTAEMPLLSRAASVRTGD